MDPPVQIGQYVLGKNLGIGAFGKVSYEKAVDIYRPQNPWCQAVGKSGWDSGETFYLSLGARLAYGLEVMVACAGGRAHMLCSRPSTGSVRILNCSHRHDPPLQGSISIMCPKLFIAHMSSSLLLYRRVGQNGHPRHHRPQSCRENSK